MNSINTLFFTLSFLLIICSLFVIFSKHPIFSLLSLVSCVLLAAFLLFLLECEFLALLFVVGYVGAIAVFFLFAVMMLESKFINLSKNVLKYLPVSFFFALLLFLPFSNIIFSDFGTSSILDSFYLMKYKNWYNSVDAVTDVEAYGSILYSYYVVHFLITGLVLLVVLVGVVYLTNTFNHKETLEQSDSKQLSRNSKSFLRY